MKPVDLMEKDSTIDSLKYLTTKRNSSALVMTGDLLLCHV